MLSYDRIIEEFVSRRRKLYCQFRNVSMQAKTNAWCVNANKDKGAEAIAYVNVNKNQAAFSIISYVSVEDYIRNLIIVIFFLLLAKTFDVHIGYFPYRCDVMQPTVLSMCRLLMFQKKRVFAIMRFIYL